LWRRSPGSTQGQRQIGQGSRLIWGLAAGRIPSSCCGAGWRVIAIDATPQAMQVLLERPDLLGRERLETVVGLLESTTWPTADLVNASLVPFLPPNAVAATWERILGSLAAGGRFAGHFFGNRVSGVNLPVRSRHSRAEVLRLLQSLDLEVFDEIERDGQTALGDPAHWHMFEVVACKRT
jgi:tellurite methyltransferase